MDWALSQAQENFRKVFTMALKDGPQEIRRGNDAVVVVRKADYLKPSATSIHGTQNFTELLLHAPKVEGLDLTRDKSTHRDVTF